MTPAPARAFQRRTIATLVAAALPAALLVWLLHHPAQNPVIAAPGRHFAIVTAVSLLAILVARFVILAALQIQHYRVLCLALGFMCMSGLFAVHAAATPGVLLGSADHAAAHPHVVAQSYAGYGYTVPDGDGAAYGGGYTAPGMDHAHSVVGLSAFLSLFVPALFFAASYTRLLAPRRLRIPFRPAAAVVSVAIALLLYAFLALTQTSLFANSALLTQRGANGIAGLSCALLLFSAWRQYRAYRKTRLPLQGALVIAFLLLIEAQLSMLKADMWTLAWWEYHVLMLAAVTAALGSLVYELRSGQPVRTILEGALGLQVEVGVELENVEELALLAAATEAKDSETQGHTVRVAEVSVAIGRELGLPYETLRVLARAGLLHDIGKIRIPDAILLKPGKLDPDEWEVMKTHPQLGLDIVQRLGGLEREAEILIAHHERMNGSGYPRGLVGDAIPLEARLIAVADTFDAIVSDRPYRRALPRERALAILQEESGTHLYPPAVQAFLRIVDSGRLGEVVDGIYRRVQPGRAA